ncbi:MAG: ATP-binding cassette domain-containing protein [Verrucomicrobiales bacterium]
MSEPAPTSTPLIELVDAAVAPAEVVNPTPLITDVNWRVSSGEFWAVAGLPGTGKTDLLATAAGLQKPLQGEHYLFSKNIRHMDEHELVEKRLRVGMVFSNGRLFPQMSIQDNIALPICYHNNCTFEEAADRVNDALELTELKSYATKKPGQVTRNLHPRIGLARALALMPEVLLIDNTLSIIDPRQGKWWLDFLGQLSRGHPAFRGKKITIVAATDDFRPWLVSADNFALIKDKKWMKIGSSDDLQKNPDPLVKEFLLASHRHWS